MKTNLPETTKIALFKGRKIRRTIYNDEWWFVVEDVILALTNSLNPKDYINKMRRRDEELSKGYGQIVHILFIETTGGRQKMNCANTEGIFRIVQSIPSPQAEPFKRWLARVGYERIQEIEDPELMMKRMKILYGQKGYPKEWIEKRARGIAIRNELTDEWKTRGAKEALDYAILTNDIMKGAFNLTVEEYKTLKGLKRENLRDHMDDIELILTMLGEATTTRFHRDRDSLGFPQLDRDAKDGGKVAGRTRIDIEKRSKKKIISSKNYLPVSKILKRNLK